MILFSLHSLLFGLGFPKALGHFPEKTASQQSYNAFHYVSEKLWGVLNSHPFLMIHGKIHVWRCHDGFLADL